MKCNTKIELIALVSELFRDKGFEVDSIEYADLVNDLGMDSITFISMIVLIEDRFNIMVPDDMLLIENFKSVDDIVAMIENKISVNVREEEALEDV